MSSIQFSVNKLLFLLAVSIFFLSVITVFSSLGSTQFESDTASNISEEDSKETITGLIPIKKIYSLIGVQKSIVVAHSDETNLENFIYSSKENSFEIENTDYSELQHRSYYVSDESNEETENKSNYSFRYYVPSTSSFSPNYRNSPFFGNNSVAPIVKRTSKVFCSVGIGKKSREEYLVVKRNSTSKKGTMRLNYGKSSQETSRTYDYSREAKHASNEQSIVCVGSENSDSQSDDD